MSTVILARQPRKSSYSVIAQILVNRVPIGAIYPATDYDLHKSGNWCDLVIATCAPEDVTQQSFTRLSCRIEEIEHNVGIILHVPAALVEWVDDA